MSRPADWIEGADVVFLGWRELAFNRCGQFSVGGEVYGGKGLASCLLVEPPSE